MTVSSVESGKNSHCFVGASGKSAATMSAARKQCPGRLLPRRQGPPSAVRYGQEWRERDPALAPRPPRAVAAGPTAASCGGGRCHVPPGAPAATRGGGPFPPFHSQLVPFGNLIRQGVLLDKNSPISGSPSKPAVYIPCYHLSPNRTGNQRLPDFRSSE